LVKTTSSITVQFSRYDSELRAHHNGAPKETSYNHYKPAVNSYSTTFSCFFTLSVAQLSFILMKAPAMGAREKTRASIQTIQFIFTNSQSPGRMTMASRMKKVPTIDQTM